MTSAWTPPLLDLGLDDTIRWNEALAFSGEPIALEMPGSELAFRPGQSPAVFALVAVISVKGLNQPLLVCIREFSFAKVCGAELSIEDVDALPDGLREALYEGMITHFWTGMGEQERDLWRLRKVQRLEELDDQQFIDTQWFEMVLMQDGEPWAAFDLCISRHDALQVIGHLSLEATPSRMIIGQGIRVPADFTIGSLVLTYRELRSLKAGAIVVMAKREPDIWQLRVEDTLYSFVADEDEWCCQRVEFVPGSHEGRQFETWEAAMDDEPKDTSKIEGLCLTLVFEIGRRSVPLSELSGWREGALIHLDPPAIAEGMEVTIRAHGSIVGTGDLVRIDDRIAVRITRLIL